MRIYIEHDPVAWNNIAESSPYAVFYHKYEVLEFRGHHWPLVFQKDDNYVLFPYVLDSFLGFRLVSAPTYDLASALPSNRGAASLMYEALDNVYGFLKKTDVDMLTMSAQFLLPKESISKLDAWFRERNASVRRIFADVLNVEGRSFEEIWRDGFSKHARNRTRKAEKEGVSVREITSFEDWVFEMYLCNMSSFNRQKRYPRYPHRDKDAFLAYLNKHQELLRGNYRVYGAFFNGRLIAYMATVQFNRVISISLLMSLSQFMSKCPNNALLAYLIKHACTNGFSWIYYSFDRVSHLSTQQGLHSSLRRFKFEHGFVEYPVPVYSLAFTLNGKILQWLTETYNHMFASSASLPTFLTDALQKLYEGQRYKKSRYKYIVGEKEHAVV